MTISVLLPTGASVALIDLNTHDLRQYYMYQMDMLEQAEGVLESLGLAGWRDGFQAQSGNPVARKLQPAPEFLANPASGNQLPTLYDAHRWQGVTHKNGVRDYPPVDTMTAEELIPEILMQHSSLQNFQVGVQALENLAKNIADATQPPDYPQE